MAPKPFNPPRPNSVATSSRRKSTTPKVGSSSKPTGISKKSPSGRKPGQERRTKSSNQAAARNKESNGASRLSSGSLAKLPSLSPLTSDGETRRDTGLETLISDDDNDDDNDDDDDDEIPVQLPSRRVNRNNSLSKRSEVDSPLAGVPRKEAAIPRDLVAVLLNEMFKNGAKKAPEQNSHAVGKRPAKGRGQTRLTKQAVGAVGKYLDTFVREAVARAAHEVIERGGDGCLEVEDLERLAPQLILDF